MGDTRWPEINPWRKTVWTPTTPPDASDVVNEKIMSAFRCVTSFPSKRIILQFWRPVSRKAVLVCGGNPFSFPLLNPLLFKYWSRCSCYSYKYNDNIDVDDPMTITGAPPSAAFLTGFPEVVMDLRVHRGTPLVDLALECELTCFVMLPVIDQESIFCRGVIEVSATHPAHLLAIFNELKQALLMAGLRISRKKAFRLPYLDIADLKLAGSETEKALHEAIHLHDITLGQVWITHVTHGICDRVLLRKLKTHHAKFPNDMSSLENFYNNLAILRLGKGEGLAGRTLETRQPHLCKNIYKLKDNRGLLALLSANAKCTSFVICLRSSHTPELDYVFEFFWPQTNNHSALIEKLLLTLKEHLPSFKHDSGAQLGHELLVADAMNSISSGSRSRRGRSSESGSTQVKIFPGNKLSKTKSSKTRELIQTNFEGENDNDDDLVIVAIYKVDYRVFFMPSSPTFQSFMEKIYKEFDLSSTGTYMIDYQVLPGEWYSLTDDTCLKNCISSYRASENIDHIKLYMYAVEK